MIYCPSLTYLHLLKFLQYDNDYELYISAQSEDKQIF
jgi:hypothetical protein